MDWGKGGAQFSVPLSECEHASFGGGCGLKLATCSLMDWGSLGVVTTNTTANTAAAAATRVAGGGFFGPPKKV